MTDRTPPRPPNASDRASDELRAVVDRYAPDYVAPALTNLLVKTARKIGLSREAVIESVNRLWDLWDMRDA